MLPGTDDHTLDRAVGHIEETAQPGTDGNLGIAGHRDGFFRGLKDITVGDVIEVDTMEGTDVYRVDRVWVVDPEDVWVLDPTPTRTLTLVTVLSVLLHRPRRPAGALSVPCTSSIGGSPRQRCRLSRRFTRVAAQMVA